MKQILFLLLASILLSGSFTSCNKSLLNEEEIDLIWSGNADETMRILTIHDKSDSLFLRSTALKVKAKDISDTIMQHLKMRMLATVNEPLVDGIGIAAPQVGVGVRMIYVQRLDKEGNPFEVYYNPEILAFGDSINSGMEGCLSIPMARGNVERSNNIDISYLDSLGNRKTESVSGFTAVIFQHEIDHLNGVLYYDHIFNGFDALINASN